MSNRGHGATPLVCSGKHHLVDHLADNMKKDFCNKDSHLVLNNMNHHHFHMVDKFECR